MSFSDQFKKNIVAGEVRQAPQAPGSGRINVIIEEDGVPKKLSLLALQSLLAGDLTPPVVSLASSSTNVTAAGNVTLTATASDAVGIAKVEFYRNGVLFATDNTSPYSATDSVGSTQNGTIIYTAKAYDNAGNASISVGVNVVVAIGGGDVVPPTVSLASSSYSVTAAGSITLTATAADNVAVAKVEFYKNGTLYAIDTTSPFTATDTFTAADNGTISYTAIAYDAANNSATSSAVSVSVGIVTPDAQAPTVSLASSSTSVTSAGAITLTATAADNVGVTKVEFYKNGNLFATDTANPFTANVSLTAADNGTINYTAKAYDAAGNVTTSSAVTVTVGIDNAAPTITLAASSTSVTAAGNVTLTATAADNVGVTKVEFYRDGTQFDFDTTAPYTTLVPFTSADNGTYAFTAKAYDAANNVTTSDAVTITVNISNITETIVSTDNFNGTNGSLITAHTSDTGESWAKVVGTADPAMLFTLGDSSTVVGPGAGYGLFANSLVATEADVEVTAVIRRATATVMQAGIAARITGVQASNLTFYLANYNGTNGNWELYRYNEGFNLLASVAASAIAVGASSTVKFKVTGTGATVTLTLNVDGTDVLTQPFADSSAQRQTLPGKYGIWFNCDSAGNGLMFNSVQEKTFTTASAGGGGTGGTPAPAPASDQPSLTAVSVNGTFTTMTFENTSGSSISKVPFTVGHVFKKGQFPNNATVGLQAKKADASTFPLQVDVKATHNDGSIRHAIISGVIPAMTANQVMQCELVRITGSTSTASTPNALISSGFTGTVTVTVGGTAYSAAIHSLLVGSYTTWLSGPIADEWMVKAPLKSAGNVVHPNLHARVTVRNYADAAKTRVDVTLENTWAFDVTQQDISLTLDVTLNGSSVYNKTYSHRAGARHRKTFWLGTAEPTLHIRHNVAYLMDSRAVPLYDTTVVPNATTLNNWYSAVTAAEPMTRGAYDADMTATGPHAHVGALPAWQVMYLLDPSIKAKAVTLGQDEIAGHGTWIHYRDANTDLPLTCVEYPYVGSAFKVQSPSINPANGKDERIPIPAGDTRVFKVDTEHSPSVGYLSYILTGDYFYLEELQFWALWNITQSPASSRAYEKGSFNWVEVRGQAWALRTMAQAAYITPDSHGLKSKLNTFLDYNLTQYNELYSYGTDPALSWGGLIYAHDAFQYGVEGLIQGQAYSGYQDDFFTLATGIAWDLDFSRAIPLLNYKKKFVINRLVNGCYQVASYYWWKVKDTVGGPVYTTWNEVYTKMVSATLRSKTCGTQAFADQMSAEDPTYGPYVIGQMSGATDEYGWASHIRNAVAYAAAIDPIDGENAWLIYDNRTVKPTYAALPSFALVPRVLTGAVDTFAGLAASASIAGAVWDTNGQHWGTKTYLVGDGAGSVKSNASNNVVANYIAQPGDVGQAVFFTVASGYDTGLEPVRIRIGASSTQSAASYDNAVSGITVLAPSFGTIYMQNEIDATSANVAATFSVDQQYCLEICQDANDNKKYNARFSNATNGVRGAVIATTSITLTTARGATDTAVQIQLPIGQANYVKIQRIESLKTAFSVGGGDVVAPTFLNAKVANATPSVVTLTFDETLGSATPATSAFAVTGRTVSAVAVSGATVNLTVSPAVANGDVLTVTYAQPGASKLADAAGNPVASFGPSSVTNNVGAATTFDFATAGSSISGPAGLVVEFGAANASAAIDIVEQLYTGFAVGFGSVTQTRWRARPITVNGVQFNIFPGLDSDGRMDVWIYATPSTISNRERANVDLRIKVNGSYQTLWDGTTTYSYTHQRGTWMRWQSTSMPWNLTKTYLDSLIANGSLLKHDHTKTWGGADNWSVLTTTTSDYRPFKKWDADDLWSQTYRIGDQNRATVGGGDGLHVGTIYEGYARAVSFIAVNNQPSWLTAGRLQALKDIAEALAQYPLVSGVLDPATKRVIDPSAKPITMQGNQTDLFGIFTGLPQPAMDGAWSGNMAEAPFDASFDNAHSPNKVSYFAYLVTKDPYHLMLAQGAAMAAIALTTMQERGADGKALRVGVAQERGMWWGLYHLAQAWNATPSGTLPAPFLQKSFLQTALDNTMTYLNTNFMGANFWNTRAVANMTGALKAAAQYWRQVDYFGTADPSGSYAAPYNHDAVFSPFMSDFGNIVLGHLLMMGYSNAQAAAQWKAVALQRRLELGGNWYLYYVPANVSTGQIFYPIVRDTDSVLPYSDAASFKTWFPYASDNFYKTGTLALSDWMITIPDGGTGTNHTQIFRAALSVTKEAYNRGLLTLPWNPNTEETRFNNEHPTAGLSGEDAWAKYHFAY